MPKFRVVRQMVGDRQYWAGDIREMVEADAAPLVARGLLEPLGKAEPAPQNKAETVPANKAERGARRSK